MFITSYYITLNSVRQHNHFITQSNYKATCFDYSLVILRPILSIVSQDAMHTLGCFHSNLLQCHFVHHKSYLDSRQSNGMRQREREREAERERVNTEEYGERTVSVPLCPPQILLGLCCNRSMSPR